MVAGGETYRVSVVPGKIFDQTMISVDFAVNESYILSAGSSGGGGGKWSGT